jgi:hypothetical protein
LVLLILRGRLYRSLRQHAGRTWHIVAHLHHIETALRVSSAGFGDFGEKFADGRDIATLSSVGTSC